MSNKDTIEYEWLDELQTDGDIGRSLKMNATKFIDHMEKIFFMFVT